MWTFSEVPVRDNVHEIDAFDIPSLAVVIMPTDDLILIGRRFLFHRIVNNHEAIVGFNLP